MKKSGIGKKATKTVQITEGKARLVVPEASFKDPFHLEVFYNSKMEFNRTISSLAFKASLPLLSENPAVVDGLCSQGARGIRYYLESGPSKKRFYFVDANTDAMKYLKKNVKLNKLKNAKIVNEDLNAFFANSEEYFDFIEIDPFGSPVFFLENAIRLAKKTSVLSVTATDLANLAGARIGPCLRHYGAKPLACEYAHEIALRILLGKIALSAGMQDFSVKPLFSFYQLHFVKTMVLLEKGAEKADTSLKQTGFISHCHNCLYRETGKVPKEKCPECGNSLDYAGPLWLGKLQVPEFLKSMSAETGKSKAQSKEKIANLLSLLAEENHLPPTFYDLHVFAKKRRTPMARLAAVIDSLKANGFAACRTHFSSTSLKTNADIKEIEKAVRN